MTGSPLSSAAAVGHIGDAASPGTSVGCARYEVQHISRKTFTFLLVVFVVLGITRILTVVLLQCYCCGL